MKSPRPPVPRTRRGPLRAGEIAEAVVLGDVSLLLVVVGQVMPLGNVLVAAAVVPLAVVAARHRFRAVVAATVAASAVGLLVIGTAAPFSMAPCAAFGMLIGVAERRRWSVLRTYAVGIAVIWPLGALAADLLLFLLPEWRKLVLDQIRNIASGIVHFLNAISQAVMWLLDRIGLESVANHMHWHRLGHHIADAAGTALDYWWITIPALLLVSTIFFVWLAYGLSRPALRRIGAAFRTPPADEPSENIAGGAQPVPVTLDHVRVRYPGADSDALQDISLTMKPARFAAIVGPNGSGKSTLARVLAGRQPPAGGHVERPGAVGLGAAHGTAFVFQRPEAQVLGVGVRDDIVWGLHDPTSVDIDHILERVGLANFADRETSTLSGGELQRLALGAALAREPALLVSDESTAMVDAEGRAQQLALLRSLASDDGVAVVHVTHEPPEAAAADVVVALAHGRLVATSAGVSVPAPRRISLPPLGPAVVSLHGVGHVYARGTPWAHRALEGVDLTIREHEAVLVVGHNGSGKSTLAWIIAGLLTPSEGDRRVEGLVGLAFQHARLQLLRPTVLDEVRVAANVDEVGAALALAGVGLDPREFASRRIDELSGGQMRRVVLADALAARPRLIVLDEPFAGLDAQGRRELEMLLTNIRTTQQVALVIVAHDRDLPPGLVDRVVELSQGRVTSDAPADEVTEA
jgi:energy-coupling factor transport system ATP-binding protein